MPETNKTTDAKAARADEQTATPDAEGQSATQAGGAEALGPAELDERLLAALHAASDKKAVNLLVLDLRAIASFTEYFVITSGTNVRQVQAIADEVVERLKKQNARPARIEGYNAAEWVLLDYGDFIVHIFEDKARRFYDLERLWRDAARVPLPPELAGEQATTGPQGLAADGSNKGE